MNPLISQDHLDQFSAALQPILMQELELGNEIRETGEGWPEKDSIIVFLKMPFIGSYQTEKLKFTEVNDTHWWKAEYYDESTHHLLACYF